MAAAPPAGVPTPGYPAALGAPARGPAPDMSYARFVTLHGGTSTPALSRAWRKRFGPPVLPTARKKKKAPPPGSLVPDPANDPLGYITYLAGQYYGPQQVARQQSWLKDVVMPWAGTRIDTLSASNKAAQDAFAGRQAGISQNIGQVASQIAPADVASLSGGGMVGPMSPTAWAGSAAQKAAPAIANAPAEAANYQSLINTLRGNAGLAGITERLSSQYAGIPSVYAQKSADFIAKLTPAAMQIAASNERQKRTIAQQQSHDLMTLIGKTGGTGKTPGGLAGPSSGDPPAGYKWVRRADGGWDLKPDKSYTPPKDTPPPKPDKRLDPVALQKQGGVPWKGKGAPNNASGRFIKGNDGRWWLMPVPKAAGGGAKKPPKGRDPGVLVKDLKSLYYGSWDENAGTGRPGWAGTADQPGDVKSATRHVTDWAISVSKNFLKANGKVDWEAVIRVIDTAIGGHVGDRVLARLVALGKVPRP